MTTAAEVLDAAKSLPRAERAEITLELLATLGTADIPASDRLAVLREAVNVGIAQLDRGEGIRVPADALGEYIRGLGQIATDRVARRSERATNSIWRRRRAPISSTFSTGRQSTSANSFATGTKR